MDPEKLVRANILEQDRGYKTGDMITAETNGGDYNENLRTIKDEFDKLAEVKTPDNIAAQSATQAPAQSRNNTTQEDGEE
ncbi:MAG: hypothetical protein EHM48_02975 [Planctomycetaceae bacterium]|nr:MAG: hypothetical protein EHM48_02975 [Planctomycetaceae bacterium]